MKTYVFIMLGLYGLDHLAHIHKRNKEKNLDSKESKMNLFFVFCWWLSTVIVLFYV